MAVQRVVLSLAYVACTGSARRLHSSNSHEHVRRHKPSELGYDQDSDRRLFNPQDVHAHLFLATTPTATFCLPTLGSDALAASSPHILARYCPHDRQTCPCLRSRPHQRPRPRPRLRPRPRRHLRQLHRRRVSVQVDSRELKNTTLEKLRASVLRANSVREQERRSRISELKRVLFKGSEPDLLDYYGMHQWEKANDTWGPDHVSTLQTMMQFAHSLQGRGNLEVALAVCKQVLDCSSHGSEHPQILQFQRTYLEMSLKRQSKMSDYENATSLDTKVQLAITMFQLGELTQAEALQQEIQQARHSLLGAQHPDTLATSDLFVDTFQNISERRACDFAPDHRDTLKSQNDLARAHYQLRNFEEAEKVQRVVLQARKRSLGPKVADTLLTMSDLAATLRDQKQFEEAMDLQKQVVRGRRDIFGSDHPETLESARQLGITQQMSGDLKNASMTYRYVYGLLTRKLGPQHQETLRSAGDLAIIYQQLKKYKSAEELQWQVLNGNTALFGHEDPRTLESKDRLADTLEWRGDLDVAQSLLQNVLEVREKLNGSEYPQTLMSKQCLANLLQYRRELRMAETLQRQVLEVRNRTLGPDQEETLSIKSDLATTLFYMQRQFEAKQVQQEVYEVRNRTLGPGHPVTIDSMKALAFILDDYGDRQGAEDMKRKILEARKLQLEQISAPSAVTSSREVSNGEVIVGDPVTMPKELPIDTDAKMRAPNVYKPKWPNLDTSNDWFKILRETFTDEVTRQCRKYVFANMCWASALWIAHWKVDLQRFGCLAALGGFLRPLGTGIFLLLSFRIKAANDRCEQGKQIWRDLKGYCVELAQHTVWYSRNISTSKREGICKFVRRFPFVLAEHLGYPSDQGQHSTQDDNPHAVITKLGQQIHHPSNNLSSSKLRVMTDIVTKMSKQIGESESLAHEPMPRKFLSYTLCLLTLYMLLLALAFVGRLGVWIVPSMAFQSWALFSILEIGREIEQPFKRELKLQETNRQIANTVDQILHPVTGDDNVDEIGW